MRCRHALLAGTVVSLFAACGGGVEVDSPHLDRSERAACDGFLDALPSTLEGLDERDDVSPDDAPARAWGDPAVVVVCGAGMPDDFTEVSPCEQINDVGWFVRPEEFADQDASLDMTTIGFRPAVRLQVPAEHRPPADVLVTVSEAVKAQLTRVGRCS